MQPFKDLERIMDMDAEKTDRLIARAIAALPYRRPSRGFALKVMAAVAAEQRQGAGYALKAAGYTVAAWEAVAGFCFAKLVLSNLSGIAAFLIQPGSVTQALKVAAAKAALISMKLTAAVSFAADLAAAAAGFPAYHEIAAAALVCAGVVYAVSGRKAGYSYGGN